MPNATYTLPHSQIISLKKVAIIIQNSDFFLKIG